MKAIIITPFLENKIKDSVEIRDDDFIICADTSFSEAIRQNIKIDLIIGDFDSGHPQSFPTGIETITVPAEKDDSDTLLCVKEAIKRGFDKIVIAGGIGGRLDHTFANIQTLYYGRVNGVDISISDGKNEAMILYPGVYDFEKRNGFYLSVFAYSEKVAGLNLKGVKYTLENADITNFFPIGLSNEIVSESAEVSFSNGVVLVIFSKKI